MATNEGEEGPFRREGAIISVSAKQGAVCNVSTEYLHTEVHFYTHKYSKLLVLLFLL